MVDINAICNCSVYAWRDNKSISRLGEEDEQSHPPTVISKKMFPTRLIIPRKKMFSVLNIEVVDTDVCYHVRVFGNQDYISSNQQ